MPLIEQEWRSGKTPNICDGKNVVPKKVVVSFDIFIMSHGALFLNEADLRYVESKGVLFYLDTKSKAAK
jgi:hypothetical protein